MSQDNNELIDSQNDTETTENEVEIQEETTPEAKPEDDVEALKEQNRKLFERAKKAEGFEKQADGSWVKKPKPVATQTTITPPVDTADELRLIARGLDDDAIEQAKIIAKGKNISLPEATKDPLFEAYQDKQKEIQRKEKAKLGASKGSSPSIDEPSISGMNRDDHKALFDKTMGKN